MAYNPSLQDLISIFRESLDKDVVCGVYHDMHGHGSEAAQVLLQLKKSIGAGPKKEEVSSKSTNSNGLSGNTPKHSVLSSKKLNPNSRKFQPKRISNSIGEQRGLQNAVRIPGYHDRKALYIMRGLSGSGKSTYAKKIVDEMGRGEIFSTDEFFMLNEVHEYRFVPADLDVAHKWNQERVEGALCESTSPVIVDNTNTQFWEMRPYVIAGVENGYNCYFIEPPTNWKFKVNILYKKSKHGLSKAQLVAALKRYEKNPTAEKVIGAGYKPKVKHAPPAQNRADKSKQPITTAASTNLNFDKLVPYNISDSSDEPAENNNVETAEYMFQSHSPVCSNYRAYNNNSKSPKVITKEGQDCGALKRDSGLFNLGISEYNQDSGGPSRQDEIYDDDDGDDELIGSCESDVAEWDQDMSDWLAEIGNREIEDTLLHKLERQNIEESEEEKEEMNGIIEMQQQREKSFKQLSTWESDNQINTVRDKDENVSQQSLQYDKSAVKSEDVKTVTKDDHVDQFPNFNLKDKDEFCFTDIEHLPTKCSDKSAFVENNNVENNQKCSISSKAFVPSVIGNNCIRSGTHYINRFVPKMTSLKDICKTKLKSQLIVSYHNSSAYWEAVQEAKHLSVVNSWAPLPNPPEPKLSDEQANEPTFEQSDHCSELSDMLNSYAVVSKDVIELSPITVAPVSRLTVDLECSTDNAAYDPAHTVIEEVEEIATKLTTGVVEENNTAEENELTREQEVIVKEVESIFGTARRKSIIFSCEECDWDADEVLECLLLKESLREMAEEAMQEEYDSEQDTIKVSKLPKIEPPSIKSLLSGEEGSPATSENEAKIEKVEEEKEVHQQAEYSSNSNSTASKAHHDIKDSREVAKLTLPPKLVSTLTQLYGTIVGIDSNKSATIPVSADLASHLHAALYFAHVEGKMKRKSKGKETVKKIAAGHCTPPPLVPRQSALPFKDIVNYQSKLPKRMGKLKKLTQAFPGIDESFLDDVLTSCGNELQRALNVLKTDSVRLKYMDDEDTLYSTRTETPPQKLTGSPSTRQYTSVHGGSSGSNGDNIFIPPGSVMEQAEACRAHSKHNMEQAKRWHSRKQHLVAAHYAKKGAKYKELAKSAELELFNGAVVTTRLKELKNNPIIDLHGYTLPQSKYLVTEAIKHVQRMIVRDPEFPRTITIITGKGLHSAGGVPRLKYGIKSLLEKHCIQCHEEADSYKLRFK